MSLDLGIFARHLDLTPLGARQRGRVRCIFHHERTPSLSVDLEAGVFHCFGCGVQGGVTAFAVRVGEAPVGIDTRPAADEAWWLVAMRLARRQPWSDELVGLTYEVNDWIRRTHQDVARVRAEAVDTEAGWEMLARASALQRVAWNAEEA